jgi:WD40 repeat protein
VCSLAYSASGRYILSGSTDGTVCLWDSSKESPILKIQHRDGQARKLALRYDGRIAAVMGDTAVNVWDMQKRRKLCSFSRHKQLFDFCVDVAFERIVCACGDEGIMSYNIADSSRHTHEAVNHTEPERKLPYARCVCILPCEQYVISGSADILYFWDIKNNRLLTMIPCGGTISHTAASSDGQMIAVMTHKGAELWRCAWHYQFPGCVDTLPERAEPYLYAAIERFRCEDDGELLVTLRKELQNRGMGAVRDGAIAAWINNCGEVM